MSRTVKIESAPRAEQLVLLALAGQPVEPRIVTVHKAGAVYTLLGGKVAEVKGSVRLTYSADLEAYPHLRPAACTVEGHGPKAQRPGGAWFCRECYRVQQATYRARKRGDLPPAELDRGTAAAEAKVDRLMARLALFGNTLAQQDAKAEARRLAGATSV